MSIRYLEYPISFALYSKPGTLPYWRRNKRNVQTHNSYSAEDALRILGINTSEIENDFVSKLESAIRVLLTNRKYRILVNAHIQSVIGVIKTLDDEILQAQVLIANIEDKIHITDLIAVLYLLEKNYELFFLKDNSQNYILLHNLLNVILTRELYSPEYSDYFVLLLMYIDRRLEILGEL